MTDIEDIKKYLALNSDLDKNLTLLVDISINNKTLKFDNNIDSLDIEILTKAEVIRFSSNVYRINQNSLFGYKFYQRYKTLLKVKLTKEFKEIAVVLNKIDLEFNTDKYNQGFSSLKKELWAFAILETNEKFKSDFSDYISSLNPKKDREEIFSFYEAYSIALPFIEINIETFYTNSKQLIEWTIADSDLNFPLGILIKGIRDKIYRNNVFGLDCFEFALKQKEIEIDLLIPMISGLYDKLEMNFYKKNLKKLINKDEYSIAIICGLSNVKSIRKEESELLLQLYEKFNNKSTEILIQLPKLLFAILKSDKLRSNSKYFRICFFHLEELISINNQNLIHFILRQHEYAENHINARQNLILKLIEKPHFKIETYLNSINQFLWIQKDVKYFEQIINSLAQNCPFQSVSKLFHSSIHELLNKDKVSFDEVLIKLLINDKSSHRFVGLDIFNELSQSSYTFDFNILALGSLNQYKLWVSICQYYREPKYIIPCLLPLFKSNSPIVKEAFICKMEEYSENYGGYVTEVIKSNVDFHDKELKEIYDRIDKYRDTHYKNNVLVKQKIKELNPFYSQNKLFTEYNKNHSRIFSRQIQKSTDQHSTFLNFFSKVTLLKGGGWKMDGKKEISKLGNFSSSFSLPRIYFTQPENFDFEMNVTSSKNWDDNSFIEIKNALKNEQ